MQCCEVVLFRGQLAIFGGVDGAGEARDADSDPR